MINSASFIDEIDTDTINIDLPVLQSLPFSEVFLPWIAVAKRRLDKIKQPLNVLMSEALVSMEIALLKRLSRLCSPTMLHELELDSISFKLKGNTSEERYQDFIRRTLFGKKALTDFFDKYKELGGLVETFLSLWVKQMEEFLSRLDTDLPLLAHTFNKGQPLGKVSSLTLDAGDAHHEGRTVYIATFDCGKSLVYKPKNLNIVETFYAFIDKLNEEGLDPPLKSYVALSRDDYGWEEKVEQKPCESLNAVKLYYTRSGMLLCLLYLLEGADMHFENLIAFGPWPMLIDLETLFQSKLHLSNTDRVETDHSVLDTGFLPFFTYRKMRKGVDISGLGMQEKSIFRIAIWEKVNTDEMDLVYKTKEAPRFLHQVIFNDKSMKADDYINFIVSGFTTMYEFIKKKRPLVEEWILRMSKCRIRIVLRPTRLYYHLLQNLHRPEVILNPELKNKRLSFLEEHAEKSDKNEAIIKEERKALQRGDIPCFHSFPTSKGLYSKEALIAENCFEKTAFECVILRLQSMNAQDRKKQESLIRGAFVCKKI